MFYAYTYYSVKVQWEIEYHLKSELMRLQYLGTVKGGQQKVQFDETELVKKAQRASQGEERVDSKINASREEDEAVDEKPEMEERHWRQNSFIVDDYDHSVQKNDKKMQEPMH